MKIAPTSQLLPTIEGRTITCTVDLTIHPLPAIQRACYWFTDRCIVGLGPGDHPNCVRVELHVKDDASPDQIAGEFMNALLDYTLRYQIEQETGPLRALIYAQAFAESDDSSDA